MGGWGVCVRGRGWDYLALVRRAPSNTGDLTHMSLENKWHRLGIIHFPDVSIIVAGSTQEVGVIWTKSSFDIKGGIQVS